MLTFGKKTGALVLVALAAFLSPALAQAIPADSTALVDRPSGFGGLPFDGANESQSRPHAVSATGRYVVFASLADVLLDGDDDFGFNVYRLDRANGRVEQVNTTPSGGQPDQPSLTGG